ncbi:pentatricopeptide repeat-containing protein At5g14770, mitochondrial-like [Impatiens glandulifera]|uniref:pentatricopeptide repeat-containing protein At5g14770, mitochondrial-like n=1 Tax=Impatiens glandulifera TaxID=253017 RepID=UPI001FB0E841|nr:pentatricopeptide repeat-containing protein At5g14770, mitochondrial-like [Impatiens glandulifera]
MIWHHLEYLRRPAAGFTHTAAGFTHTAAGFTHTAADEALYHTLTVELLFLRSPFHSKVTDFTSSSHSPAILECGFLQFSAISIPLVWSLRLGFVHQALGLVSIIWSRKVPLDSYTCNILVKGFCDIGLLEYAHLFMISIVDLAEPYPDTLNDHAFCKNRRLEEAKLLLDEMRKMGVDPNHVSFSTLIDSSFRKRDLMSAFSLQAQMVVRGYAFDVVICTILMDGLFKAGKPAEAEEMYKSLWKFSLIPDCITYFVMNAIYGSSKLGEMKRVDSLLNEMAANNVYPDVITYSSVINGHIKKGMLYSVAEELVRDLVSKGLTPDCANYTSMMDVFFKEGNESAALSMAQEVSMRNIGLDTIAYNVLINGLSKLGNYRIESLFDGIKHSGLSFLP